MASTKSILGRVPYITIIASIIGIIGIVVFDSNRQEAGKLIRTLFADLFNLNTSLLAKYESIFFIYEIVFIIVTVLVLILSVLSTGDTRHQVFAGWKMRVCGKFLCMLLIVTSLILYCLWMVIFAYWSSAYAMVYSSKYECDFIQAFIRCVTFTSYNLFIDDHKHHNYYYCFQTSGKTFCPKFIDKAKPVFTVIPISCAFIGIALIFYLICLTANYARIRDKANLQELEELRSLDLDLIDSKQRF